MNVPAIYTASGRVYDVVEGLRQCDYCACFTPRVVVIPEREHALYIERGGGLLAVCLRCRDAAGIPADGFFARDEGNMLIADGRIQMRLHTVSDRDMREHRAAVATPAGQRAAVLVQVADQEVHPSARESLHRDAHWLYRVACSTVRPNSARPSAQIGQCRTIRHRHSHRRRKTRAKTPKSSSSGDGDGESGYRATRRKSVSQDLGTTGGGS